MARCLVCGKIDADSSVKYNHRVITDVRIRPEPGVRYSMTEEQRTVKVPIHRKCLVRNRILQGLWILAPGFLWVAFGLTPGIGLPWLRAVAFIGALLFAALAVLLAIAVHRNFQQLCQLYLQVNEPELWSRISGGSYLDRILGSR